MNILDIYRWNFGALTLLFHVRIEHILLCIGNTIKPV